MSEKERKKRGRVGGVRTGMRFFQVFRSDVQN